MSPSLANTVFLFNTRNLDILESLLKDSSSMLENEFKDVYKAPLTVLRKINHKYYFLRSFYDAKIYDKEVLKAFEYKLRKKEYRLYKYDSIIEHINREIEILLTIGNSIDDVAKYMYNSQHEYIDNRLYINFSFFQSLVNSVYNSDEFQNKTKHKLVEKKYAIPLRDKFYNQFTWMLMMNTAKCHHNAIVNAELLFMYKSETYKTIESLTGLKKGAVKKYYELLNI